MKRFNHFSKIFAFLFMVGLALSGAACGLSGVTAPTKTLVKTCLIPSDQSGTISGRWPASPIPLAFHQGDFDTTSEIAPMIQAVDIWNAFFTASKSIRVIDAGTASAPTLSTSTNSASSLCGTSIATTSGFSGVVVVYKLGTWPYAADAMALTSFCTVAQTPYKKMKNAVMELNYQNFFVAGKKLPDLVTIFAHELGHLLGLDHSCSSTPKTGFPTCSDPTLNRDYGSDRAIMFPSFGFYDTGLGVQQRSLGVDDQQRANCLYGSQ